MEVEVKGVEVQLASCRRELGLISLWLNALTHTRKGHLYKEGWCYPLFCNLKQEW
ncbi:hypothetical protein GIB67_015630 [Kingdonia uniflora]|uniref:Uncharacterized protein n=1 Tax=Kingdonia uniflora TaxID=39325 RepID=A0A7J7NUU4_9MAGN|nr:hypothetical protein GIB67_015630 [Kingdonia uniflora]